MRGQCLACLLLLSVSLACCQNLTLPAGSKTHYVIGGLAIRTVDELMNSYKPTFETYLNRVVGPRFNPPINFTFIALDFTTTYTKVADGSIDFIYTNPAIYGCLEWQYGLSSLVTQTNKRQGNQLTEFGGVIFTKADRDDITTVKDLRNQKIAAASISGLGSGQAQWLVMQKIGMSLMQDPSQVVFTGGKGGQVEVVKLVAEGLIDVGFVRTDQIERMESSGALLYDGTPTLKSKFKYINTATRYSNGAVFPFEGSTDLYPEWNLAATKSVPVILAQQVQEALYDINSTSTEATSGKYVKWQQTLSYTPLINMVQRLGVMVDDGAGNSRCQTASELYDLVVCPAGSFKKSKAEFDTGCPDTGLSCAYKAKDFTGNCICKPCVYADEVEIIPVYYEGAVTFGNVTTLGGATRCGKMEVCVKGSQQLDKLPLIFKDNKKRPSNSSVTYVLHYGSELINGSIGYVNTTDSGIWYALDIDSDRVGTHVVELFFDGVQLPNSPILIEVVPRVCQRDFPTDYELRVPDDEGVCLCNSQSLLLGGGCFELQNLLLAILLPLAFLVVVVVAVFFELQRRKMDTLWTLNSKELKFDAPPTVLGRGSFGLVLLGDYRGTTVAVKRVIPSTEEADTGDEPKAEEAEPSGYDAKGSTNAIPNGGAFTDSLADLESGASQSSATTVPQPVVVPKESNAYAGTASMVGKQLGRGIFGSQVGVGSHGGTEKESPFMRVFLGKGYLARRKVAGLKRDFIEEMRIVSKLRHPSVTTVMGAVLGKEPMLIMEYMTLGSLYDILMNESYPFESDVLLFMLRDIVQGMRFLHTADPPIVHGDLKAANVLITENFKAKVADFGLSQKKRLGNVGTPLWMAPELLNWEVSTPESDVYAFSIMLVEIFSRTDPYEGMDPHMVLEAVKDVNRQVVMRPSLPAGLLPEVELMIKDCWHNDPEKRPPFVELDRRVKAFDALQLQSSKILLAGAAENERQAMAQNVLFDVFPQHIAEALVAGRKPQAEKKEVVTIFFSDIVGFTDISSKLEPLKVSQMLDRLYTEFDALAEKHHVYKVETIGDAYMAVTNLVADQGGDHASRIARFSLEAVAAANSVLIDEENPGMGHINIRVGFHSGPVVANVVGTKCPRYCLFGDTVNTASRMESYSEKNKINISRAAASYVLKQAPDIVLKKRGAINIKGKGVMSCYWVCEEKVGDAAGRQPRQGGWEQGGAGVFNAVQGSSARDIISRLPSDESIAVDNSLHRGPEPLLMRNSSPSRPSRTHLQAFSPKEGASKSANSSFKGARGDNGVDHTGTNTTGTGATSNLLELESSGPPPTQMSSPDLNAPLSGT